MMAGVVVEEMGRRITEEGGGAGEMRGVVRTGDRRMRGSGVVTRSQTRAAASGGGGATVDGTVAGDTVMTGMESVAVESVAETGGLDPVMRAERDRRWEELRRNLRARAQREGD